LLDDGADRGEHRSALGGYVAAEDAYVPGAREDQTEQHAHRRRLARPVRPEEAVEVALLDLEVEALHRRHRAVVLDQAAGLDNHAHNGPAPRDGRLLARLVSLSGGTAPMMAYSAPPLDTTSPLSNGGWNVVSEDAGRDSATSRNRDRNTARDVPFP